VGARRAALVAGVALAAAGLAPPGASAHSLARKRGDRIVYVARDATSLNALTVRVVGDEIALRDTAVEGGIDPGPCRPVDVAPRSGWIVEVRCPSRDIAGLDADLGDREDRASMTVPLPAVLRGGPGADELRGNAAFDVLLGGNGADRIAGGGGRDRIAGDAGDDTLEGEDGDDDIDGGLGRDRIDGGVGADAVHARDGQADGIVCGAGEDRVEADTLDEVAGDCERVGRVAVPPPPEPGPAGADGRSPRVRAGAARRQAPGRVRILATSSERGVLSASGYLDAGGVSLPVQGDRRRVAVGGAGVALRVRLGGRARRAALRALRRGRRATLRMGVVGTDRSGNSRLVAAPPIRLRGPRARAAHPEPGDVDGDGVGDAADNCAFFRNADQADLDGDAAGDACDRDPDGDGAEARGGDNCRLADNPDQADADGNGFGDACDRDSDGDGVRDPVDSCPAIRDDQRADLDGDRQGDACDPDDDDDGVFDARDRCPRAPDPLQADRDLDGLGGACDLDEPPARRWRPADGAWPADRRPPRLGVRAVAGRALRVTCSERCFVIVRMRRRGATVAQATAALAGPGVTYVFLPARGSRAEVEASDPFGNATRATRRIAVRR